MAFTEGQKVTLRLLLGYPDIFRQHNPRLESVFDIIGERPETQAAVETLIEAVVDFDPQLVSLLQFAGLKRAEDVEWYQNLSSKWSAPQEAVRSHGRMLIGRISRLMGVPILGDYFGTGGYPGDWFMGSGNQMSGGVVPLG
jgi:hypothetical protein